MEKTLDVTFNKYANLEFVNSLANCFLITDGSCEEIYNDKEFVQWCLSQENHCYDIRRLIKINYASVVADETL